MKAIKRIGLAIREKDLAFARFRAKYHIHRAMDILGRKQENLVGFVTFTAVSKELNRYGRTIKSGQKRTGVAPQCDTRDLSGRIRALETGNQALAEAREHPEGSHQGSPTGRGGRDRRGELYRGDHPDRASEVEYWLNQGAYGREMGNGAHDPSTHDSDPYQTEGGGVTFDPTPLASRQTFLCQTCSLGYTSDPSVPCLECQEREHRKH